MLNSSWRVIATIREPSQWVIQQKSGQRRGMPIWRGISFHQHRASLIRRANELAGIIDPEALETITRLPAHILDGGGT
jgi:hypothetical protein